MGRAWLDPVAVDVPVAFGAAVGGHPLVAQTLVRRGLQAPEAARAFLDPDFYTPAPPDEMPGMEDAVKRIALAIRRRELICVWGDFDVDGQTATTLLVAVLRGLGARVTFHIPVRQTEAHGVNVPVLQDLIAGGTYLLLTCDTGIAAHEAILYAQSRGVDVIVTDHHILPAELPPAYAAINPQFLPPGHPLATLPGVGVAYKLAEALCARAGQPELVAGQLDLVALGIVADVAVLAGDTRYLLQRGLAALQRTARPGLQAMLALNQLDTASLNEEHIGYILAPRLNALGRLADANRAVEFLTTSELEQARIFAANLESLNAQRKLMCDQVYQAAEAQIERDPSLLESAALVLSGASWPAGVIGIVAGRLAERYNRPAVLIAAPPGQPARGSARSVAGCNITAAIAAQADMLLSFGGHPMAAGLSLDAGRIPEFRRALGSTVAGMVGAFPAVAPLQIDGYLSLSELSLDLVDDLERLAPMGPGNPPLVLAARGLSVTSVRPAGRGDEHLLVTVEDDSGVSCRLIWWGGGGAARPAGHIDLAYTVRSGDYRGQRQVQVEWIDAHPAGGENVAGEVPAEPATQAIETVDFRGEAAPRQKLEALRAAGEVQVWCEGQERAALNGRGRHELAPGLPLVVWTAPPGRAELEAVLRQAAPPVVYLFGRDPGTDSSAAFLQRLAGLARYALRTNGGRGRVALPVLAAATAQRVETVRCGLSWLAARGHLSAGAEEDGVVLLVEGGRANTAAAATVMAELEALLAETAAYRAYFQRTSIEALFGGTPAIWKA